MYDVKASIHYSDHSDDTTPSTKPTNMIRNISVAIIIFVVVTFLVISFVRTLNQAPADFPVNQPITIESGTSVRAITEQLDSANVVRSGNFLYYIVSLFYDPVTVKASSYIFTEPLTTVEIAKRLTEGDFDTDLIRFTHIEGERVTLIAEKANELLPNFNTERFVTAATPLEGRLFPETYFIPVTYTDEDLLALLTDTFNTRIAPLQEKIEQQSLTLNEILVLASIIEREANTIDSKKLVSGILQNRLEIGMALQADASIEYILDKPLADLTPEDLEVDSPYNTYLNTGLPPTPIGNPGLEAITAVLEPTESDYFYYLTDDEGEFHYAKTYTEHLQNIERYLR
jgi:UPF0755 protein